MGWLTGVPVLVALPLFAVLPATVAVAVHTVVRRNVAFDRLSEQHDVAGYLVAVVGVLYSVVLGFLVGTVWTQFAAAQQTADSEAGSIADAFNYARNVQPPQSLQLRRLIAKYAIEVRDVEWFSAQNGREDPRAQRLLTRTVLLTIALPPPPTSRGAGAILEGTTMRTFLLTSLREIGDARRLRLVQSESHLPAGMLEALVLGGVMVVSFVFFFGIKSYFRQMAMTALVTGSIGLFFGLVLELSTPYSGAVHISRDAWTYVIDNNDLTKYAK